MAAEPPPNALPQRADEAQCRVFHLFWRGWHFLGHPQEARMAAYEDDELCPEQQQHAEDKSSADGGDDDGAVRCGLVGNEYDGGAL